MLLETNYRERLHMVTNEVKRRLDYQIALQHLQRRMEQDHMINWVEKNVISSITPQQVSPLFVLIKCLKLNENLELYWCEKSPTHPPYGRKVIFVQ